MSLSVLQMQAWLYYLHVYTRDLKHHIKGKWFTWKAHGSLKHSHLECSYLGNNRELDNNAICLIRRRSSWVILHWRVSSIKQQYGRPICQNREFTQDYSSGLWAQTLLMTLAHESNYTLYIDTSHTQSWVRIATNDTKYFANIRFISFGRSVTKRDVYITV